MSALSRIIYADSAGPNVQKLYNQSHMALAALVPAGLVSADGSVPQKVADLGLAAVIPIHSHVALNYVVSDYVPKGLRLPARLAVLGISTVTFLGLTKLAITGPGFSGAIKQLWTKPQPQAA